MWDPPIDYDMACGIRRATSYKGVWDPSGRLLRLGVWDPPVGFCETRAAAAVWASDDDHNFETFFSEFLQILAQGV